MQQLHIVFLLLVLFCLFFTCSSFTIVKRIDAFIDTQRQEVPPSTTSVIAGTQYNIQHVMGNQRGMRTNVLSNSGASTHNLISDIGGSLWLISVPQGVTGNFMATYTNIGGENWEAEADGVSVTVSAIPFSPTSSQNFALQIQVSNDCHANFNIQADGIDHTIRFRFSSNDWTHCDNPDFSSVETVSVVIRSVSGWVTVEDLYLYKESSALPYNVQPSSRIIHNFDEFRISGDEPVIAVGLPDGSQSNLIRSIRQQNTDALGGERDLIIWVQQTPPGSYLKAAVENNWLVVDMPANSAAMVLIQYDGEDDSSSVSRDHLQLNLLGDGASAFEFISYQSETVLFQITAFSKDDNFQCTTLKVLMYSETPVVTRVPFRDLSRECNMYNIGAVQFTVQASSLVAPLRFVMSQFYTV